MRKYTTANVKGKFRDYNKRLQFDILENGIAIARVTRKASRFGFIEELQFKFYTEQSKRRFQDYCDSLSMSEACEALLP